MRSMTPWIHYDEMRYILKSVAAFLVSNEGVQPNQVHSERYSKLILIKDKKWNKLFRISDRKNTLKPRYLETYRDKSEKPIVMYTCTVNIATWFWLKFSPAVTLIVYPAMKMKMKIWSWIPTSTAGGISFSLHHQGLIFFPFCCFFRVRKN